MAKTLGASLVLALLVMMVIFLNGTTLAAGRGYPVNDAGGQVYQPDCIFFCCHQVYKPNCVFFCCPHGGSAGTTGRANIGGGGAEEEVESQANAAPTTTTIP